MADFPTAPDQLTNEWLSAVLGAPVRDHEVEYFSEGTGVMAWVSRLRLDADAPAPASLIIKFASPSEVNRAVARQYDMYGREVGFYRHIASQIELTVPRCFHVEFAPETDQFVLLLEDLGALRIGDQVAGCNEQEATMIVRAIASLHASGWQPVDMDLISHNNPSQVEGMVGGVGIGWPVIQETFADLVPAAAADVGEQLPRAVAPLLSRMCQPPVVLTHADVRLDNVFFDDAAQSVALVDWQSVCTSAPEQDLAYFVTQSLADEVRNARDWVAYYHECLTGLGVTYDLDQCRQRYRESALYLLCYAIVIAGTLDLSNERGAALGRTLIGNTFASLEELDAFSLLQQIAQES